MPCLRTSAQASSRAQATQATAPPPRSASRPRPSVRHRQRHERRPRGRQTRTRGKPTTTKQLGSRQSPLARPVGSRPTWPSRSPCASNLSCSIRGLDRQQPHVVRVARRIRGGLVRRALAAVSSVLTRIRLPNGRWPRRSAGRPAARRDGGARGPSSPSPLRARSCSPAWDDTPYALCAESLLSCDWRWR